MLLRAPRQHVRSTLMAGLLRSAASSAAAPEAAAAASDAAATATAAAAEPSASPTPQPDPTPNNTTNTNSSSSTIITERLGLIGAGQMASALVRALMDRGCIGADGVCASDHSTALARSVGIEKTFAAAAAGGAELVAHASDVVLIGVKPQGVPEVLAALKPHIVPSKHLVVSIAAGVTLATYEKGLPPKTRVIRVMPNTPLLVGAGASAYSLGQHATEEDERRVRALLEPGGLVIKVPEDLLDAVTAVSGSGPAYYYIFIEALADAGVAAGLSRDAALALAAQTALGAAKMVLESGDGGGKGLSLMHPAVLKDRVCSPAGTTIAGLQVLEEAGLRAAVMKAVAAAAVRAGELSTRAAAPAPAAAAPARSGGPGRGGPRAHEGGRRHGGGGGPGGGGGRGWGGGGNGGGRWGGNNEGDAGRRRL
jgi:pyrroline-5-carboxylate reductase